MTLTVLRNSCSRGITCKCLELSRHGWLNVVEVLYLIYISQMVLNVGLYLQKFLVSLQKIYMYILTFENMYQHTCRLCITGHAGKIAGVFTACALYC